MCAGIYGPSARVDAAVPAQEPSPTPEFRQIAVHLASGLESATMPLMPQSLSAGGGHGFFTAADNAKAGKFAGPHLHNSASARLVQSLRPLMHLQRVPAAATSHALRPCLRRDLSVVPLESPLWAPVKRQEPHGH